MPRSSSSFSSLRGGRFSLLASVFLCFALLLASSVALAQKNDVGSSSSSSSMMTTGEKTTGGNGNDLLMNNNNNNNANNANNEFDDYDDEDEEEFEPSPSSSSSWFFERFLQTTDSTTTTTRVNIWQKLKESIGTTIVGFILIICMPCMIWKNEGRHVRELVRIDFAKNSTVEVECNSAGDETMGQLVHFMGPVSVGDGLLDFGSGGEGKGQLDLVEPLPQALILKRTCYIYQKFEVAQTEVDKDRIGGGETQTTTYSLKEDWTTTPQPETLPHLPDHTNSRGIWDSLMEAAVNFQDAGSAGAGAGAGAPQLPPGMEALGLVDLSSKPHGVVVAPSAAVGFFGLSRKIVMENMMQFGTDVIPVPNESLPMEVEGCEGLLRGSDNVLRNFPEDAEPYNGAIKVVFEYVQDGFDCSFVVQQIPRDVEGGGVDEQPQDEQMAKFGVDRAMVEGKCSRDDYGDIWMVRRGRLSLEEMIDMAKEDEGKITKLLRILCWVGLCAGWVMLFAPFTTALSTLPILGGLGNFAVGVVALIVSLTCCCTIMTVAYIRYRPLLAFGLLAISLAIWGIVAWRLNDAAEEGGETTTTTTTTGSGTAASSAGMSMIPTTTSFSTLIVTFLSMMMVQCM